ncbi:MAG TPA: hypothetical protein PLB89_04905 [Flavobacteriales bacterium]|nr:hypothetical protein [Flavobacteriales bacterium]
MKIELTPEAQAKDLVLEELRTSIGKTETFMIGTRRRIKKCKILDVRLSRTAFAFDFKSNPASVSSAYEWRLEEISTGKRFWSPPFSAKLKAPTTAE